MASGEPFSSQQMHDVERAVMIAQDASGLDFGAYVGQLVAGRATAEAMLRSMPVPARSVVVAVDPEARTVDVVTGSDAQRWLDDERCQLAVLTMSSRFTVGDIAGGLRDGIIVLGEQAVHPPALFTDEPN